MTIAEMHRIYKLSFDKIDSLSFPDIQPEEIDEIFNINIDLFSRQRYGKNNFKRESFEETQKRIDDLKTLVKNEDINANENGDMLEAYTFDVPSDYWFLLRSFCKVKILFCNVQYGADEELKDEETGEVISTTELRRKGTQQTQIDDLNSAFDDPFNRPALQEDALLTFEEGKMKVYTGELYSVRRMCITYMREPIKVSLAGGIDCDLSDHTHQEIIVMAVNWSIENVESLRYNTHINELTKIE